MPTYDYECDACGHAFEQFQSITAPAIKRCPSCGKRKVRRLIGTGAGVIFKGSGFYSTDYRSDSYKKASAGEKPKTDASGSAGKSDAPASSAKSDSSSGSSAKSGKSADKE